MGTFYLAYRIEIWLATDALLMAAAGALVALIFGLWLHQAHAQAIEIAGLVAGASATAVAALALSVAILASRRRLARRLVLLLAGAALAAKRGKEAGIPVVATDSVGTVLTSGNDVVAAVDQRLADPAAVPEYDRGRRDDGRLVRQARRRQSDGMRADGAVRGAGRGGGHVGAELDQVRALVPGGVVAELETLLARFDAMGGAMEIDSRIGGGTRVTVTSPPEPVISPAEQT